MTDSTQLQSFQRLKTSIVEQLQWGDSTQWNNYDFEKLGEKIAEKTGVTLSVSTLKRIFGRVNYQSTPSLTTLNTLSQFAGYEDWRGYVHAVTEEGNTVPSSAPEIIEKAAPAKKQKNFRLLKIALPLVALALLGFITLNFISRKQLDTRSFRFSSKTILTEGLPNSVVFDYDASQASDQDSVFISQTWDIRRKILIDKNAKHHSSIYYYPGYFRAKLMIGDKIVQEHDLQIKTDGWLGLVEAEWGKQPLYFTKEEITKNKEIGVTDSLLRKYNVPLQPSPPQIRFFNQQDINDVNTDNFEFETEVKNDFSSGANACQRTEILLQAKNDILIVPLVNSACVGDIFLAVYGFYTDSKKDDLSGFGCNLHDWTNVKIICKNKQAKIFVNNKEVYAATVTNLPTGIVGVQFRFAGSGSVRNTTLKGESGRIINF